MATRETAGQTAVYLAYSRPPHAVKNDKASAKRGGLVVLIRLAATVKLLLT
jgi:hypothetical protein